MHYGVHLLDVFRHCPSSASESGAVKVKFGILEKGSTVPTMRSVMARSIPQSRADATTHPGGPS